MRHADYDVGAVARADTLTRLLSAFLVCFALGACSLSPSYVQMRYTKPSRALAEDLTTIASGSSLSRDSRQLLEQLELGWRSESCKEILQAVADSPLPIDSRLFALTELTFAAAHSRACAIPRDQLLLNTARLAYGQLMTACDADTPAADALLMGFYNRAVAALLTEGDHESLAERAISLGIAIEPESAGLATRFDRSCSQDCERVTAVSAWALRSSAS